MAREKVKTHKGKQVQVVDRISTLPDSIICHILSFVPTVDAVRMSLLSKRWRRMWYSVPTLQFSNSESVGYHMRKSFYKFVDNCLMHRSNATQYIDDAAATSFKLEVHYSLDSDRLAVNRWLNSPIIQNYVKELDICGKADRDVYYYYMPLVALNGRFFTSISLQGLKLENTGSVNLPSLKSLRLVKVTFEDIAILRNLNLQCPSIEKLVLHYSGFYNGLQISSSSLKFLEIRDAWQLNIECDAVNLQSLVASIVECHRISFSSCRKIRDLSLAHFGNGNNLNFDDQISKLTYLENLNLRLCEGLDHMNIVNPTLKRFSLTKKSEENMTVTTETPNLVSFEYIGDMLFSVTMKTPNPQLNGSLLIQCYADRDTDWYRKLITFFSNIHCSWNCLKLRCFGDRDLIIPKNLRKTCCPPWPNLKHLKVRVISTLTSTNKSEFRKALQWLSPSLETLCIKKRREIL